MGKRVQVAVNHEQKLRALCELSNVAEPLDWRFFSAFICQAPDPETAVRRVLERVMLPSETLNRHWRNFITDVWTHQHPQVPILPQWVLSQTDVEATPFFRDALAVLEELEQKPAKLILEHDETLLDPVDVSRLMLAMPSQTSRAVIDVENEWNVAEERRLRAALQSARLVRPYRGRLIAVRSRLDRFRRLPAAQQFYVLWHADAYHVDWADYSGLWGKFMGVMQEYLPLLWETIGEVAAGETDERASLALSIMEAYLPIWDDEELMEIPSGSGAALKIVEQHALPTIIDRFILRDLLERHGLVVITEQFGSLAKFTWTSAGAKAIAAEAEQQLPCGNNLLDVGGLPKHPHSIL